MSEFKIPPISTLIGSDLLNFLSVMRKGGKVTPAYYGKVILTALVVLISIPFHLWEYIYFRISIRKYKFRKPPLFILGHWRSGTTFLHNLLCADPDAGFLTTYHSVFPNNLASQFIFKNFMKMNMPEKRPSDNVKLGVDLPQEDEFALGNITTLSFYHFFYFPDKYQEYYENSVTSVNAGKHPSWEYTYKKLIIKALINTGGQRAVLKNPVNSARIATLLRIFPDARFLYIYRNPVVVFMSTRKFFYELFPTLWLHVASRDFIDKMIFENFRNLMKDYEKYKHLIPKENLLELRFEDFEIQPLDQCRLIYESLLREDFNLKSPYFEKFLSKQKGYSKNTYQVSRKLADKITFEWGDYIDKWGYHIPDELISD